MVETSLDLKLELPSLDAGDTDLISLNVCCGPESMSQMLSFHTNLGGRNHYSHFTDTKTEAPRIKMICPKAHLGNPR